ncbi:hypothetical protein AAZX31_13G014100 [Glycine max]
MKTPIIEGEWFTPEFLNDIRSFGLPNHRLTLKIGVPIMLLRNIDPRGDLCYGTQLIVNEMGRNIIGATILTGTKSGGIYIYIYIHT